MISKWSKLKVNQLKDELKKRNIDIKQEKLRLKKDLIKRLCELDELDMKDNNNNNNVDNDNENDDTDNNVTTSTNNKDTIDNQNNSSMNNNKKLDDSSKNESNNDKTINEKNEISSSRTTATNNNIAKNNKNIAKNNNNINNAKNNNNIAKNKNNNNNNDKSNKSNNNKQNGTNKTTVASGNNVKGKREHENGENNNKTKKLSSRALKRLRKKQRKKQLKEEQQRMNEIFEKKADELEKKRLQTIQSIEQVSLNPLASKSDEENEENDEKKSLDTPKNKKRKIEYVVEEIDANQINPEIAKVFERFQQLNKNLDTNENKNEKNQIKKSDNENNDSDSNDSDDENSQPLSKKQRKKLSRLSVAELKQLVKRPDVVDIHDCNSIDPVLLVTLKSYRNAVPVPMHWSQKRKYLQGKRGFEKPPFELPQNIKDTGIMEVRDQATATKAGKSLKQKGRERMAPKMGRLDIDYQVLHDAFFVYQRKPKDMTLHGDMYYEGKEMEMKLTDKKPGELSSELRAALGMKDETTPPPWLFNMQRYGPPKSYPHLKLPGINCPIPPGANWGHNEGEWGRPPVDQMQRSIWGGDVFGNSNNQDIENANINIDKTLWGKIEDIDEDDDDEEEEEIEHEKVGEEEEEAKQVDFEYSDAIPGQESTTSAISGMATPQFIQLRKEDGNETPQESRQLYQILEEKQTSVGINERFGSSHMYVLPSTNAQKDESNNDNKRPLDNDVTEMDNETQNRKKRRFH